MPSAHDIDRVIAQFEKDGYAIIEDYLSNIEIEELRTECADILDREINNTPVKIKEDYFVNSGDKIRLFLEEEAILSNGRLKVRPSQAINKIGHALHALSPAFYEVSHSDYIQNILRRLDFIHPAVCQSSYIFKQPKFGGRVTAHQDSSFLHTEPLGLVGFWMALEDASVDNGCLWFVPGSHLTHPVGWRFIRNRTNDGPMCISIGAAPCLQEHHYKPAPVAKGSLVIIHGSVIHKSEQNKSSRSRHAYSFHVIEQHNTSYSRDNWLQPSSALPFSTLYSPD